MESGTEQVGQFIAATQAPAVQAVARRHRENLRGFFVELIENLKAEAPDSVQVDTDTLADVYLLLFEGAIAVAASYREAWPVETAVAAKGKKRKKPESR